MTKVIIKAADGTGAVEAYHNANKKLETTATGTTVTGNIAVTGTVDGRDIATDGAKLDGIAAGANVGAALTGSTNNTVCTVTGANAIAGEANLTFEGGSTGDATLTVHAEENASTAEPILKLESSHDFAESAITAHDSSGVGGELKYNHGDNAWRVSTNGTTERLRVDSSGRTLFGHTASVNSWGQGRRLQVHGTDTGQASISINRWSNDTNSASLVLTKSRGGSPGTFAAVQNDDYISTIGFLGDDGTDLGESVARIDCLVDGTVAGNQIPGRLEFSTTKANGQSTPKMYIRAGGEVDISNKLRLGSFIANYSNAKINVYSDSNTSRIECSAANTVSTHINFRYLTTQHGSISHNQTSTSYNTSSDYRLKENQTLISDGITRLKTLKPYRFNFKATPDQTVDGFFAHEVTAVPESIFGTKDAMAPETFYEEGDTLPSGKKVGDVKTYSSSEIAPQQIDQAKLVPLLTAALQEAIAKIETLETKVAALEAG